MVNKDSNLKGEVLLLGGVASESVFTAIKSLGASYVRKELRSSPENWQRIIKLLSGDTAQRIGCVLAQFTESTLFDACQPEYLAEFQQLCEQLAGHRHIIFIYADNLAKNFTQLNFDGTEAWPTIDKEKYYDDYYRDMGFDGIEGFRKELEQVVDFLQSSGLNIAPYRTRVNLNVAAQEFLQEAFRGLLMRIYVPNDRLWASEIDKLLTLFADYLRRVGKHPVTLDQNRTEKGLIFGFYSSDDSITKEQISGALEEFSLFIKVCAEEPDKASEILKTANIQDAQLHSILTRYTKEARRLLLDIQYEKEAKLLSIRHRLQAELIDTVSVNEAKEALIQIDKSVVAGIVNPLDIINTTGLASKGETVIQSQTININNPQFIAQARGIIAREINGSIEYSEHDERLLEMFKKHVTDVEYIELKSSLDELKDTSAPQPQRTTAWQKVQGFLSKHSEALGKTGLNILEKYIEHLLTGK